MIRATAHTGTMDHLFLPFEQSIKSRRTRMFDKTKERIAKLEETNETFRKAKQHVEKNKTTYIVGAGCLVVGYVLRKPQAITMITEAAAPIIAPVFNNHNVVENTVNNGGYARKIIRCLETDQMWPSMTKAAEAAGHTLQAM